MSVLCSLNSKDRSSGTSSSFQISLAPYLIGTKTFTHVCLISCAIPKTYYLIDADLNDTFVVTEAGGDTTVTIPEGNYSIDTLTSAIGTALSSCTYTYTVTNNELTNRFVITVSGNAGFQPTFTFSNSLWQIVGFESGANAFSANSITSPNVYFLQTATTIQVNSDLCVNNGLLAEVEPSTPYGSTILYQSQYPPYQTVPLAINNPTHATFTLINGDTGNILDIHGVNWSMALSFQPASQQTAQQTAQISENKISRPTGIDLLDKTKDDYRKQLESILQANDAAMLGDTTRTAGQRDQRDRTQDKTDRGKESKGNTNTKGGRRR